MPLIHYVSGSEEVLVQYTGKLVFGNLSYRRSDVETMQIFEAKGSVGFSDLTVRGLNKIHVGSDIRHPHAESSDHDGTRVDLAELDVSYAKQYVRALESWRNPSTRCELAEWYAKHSGDNARTRIRQLRISPQGLEAKIQEARARVVKLAGRSEASYLGTVIPILDCAFACLKDHLNPEVNVTAKDKEIHKGKRLIVTAPHVISETLRVYKMLGDILQSIQTRTTIETAAQYWSRVEDWARL